MAHNDVADIQARVAAAITASREKWGVAFHMRLVQEECAELIAAINRYDRGRCDTLKVAEEVADVILVIGAARAIVGEDAVDEYVVQKLARLEARIAADSEMHNDRLTKGGTDAPK